MPAPAPWLTLDLLDAIGDGVVVFDRALHFVHVNPAAEALLRQPLGALLGRYVWDVFPAEETSGFRRALGQALGTGRSAEHCGYAPERDAWIEMRAHPYEEGVAVFFSDVSAKQRAEHEMAASERHFRRTADSVPVLIWMSDLTRGRVFFNRAWTEFTGREAADEAGEGWMGGVHPDDLYDLLTLYNASFDAEKPFQTEYRLRRADGVYRWMLVRGRPRYDASGAFEGFTGACTDIDDRRTADEQLAFLAHASELLTSSLDYEETLERIAALAVPTLADWCTVQMVSEDGQIERTINLHADAEKIRWAEEINARYPPTLEKSEGLRYVIETGEPLLVSDVTPEMIEAAPYDEAYHQILREVGITSVLVVPLRTRARVVGAITLIATFGSRRYEAFDLRFAEELARRAAAAAENAALYRSARAAEAALRELNEGLEARVGQRTAELAQANHVLALRNRELQDFAFVASHDLQEPLRKIQAFSDLVARDAGPHLDDEARHWLSRIQTSAARMSLLISDLLAFSRVATQGGDMEPVDLHAALDAALVDLEYRVEHTGGRVEAAGPLRPVRGDAVQLRQLLINLVGNSLKFHREGVAPVVRVSTAPGPDGTVVLDVADNGIGFDEKYKERVFAPFQRLHGRDVYEGTGMGLAIVRRIAERHGGSVTVESTPGEGSRFRVLLPAA